MKVNRPTCLFLGEIKQWQNRSCRFLTTLQKLRPGNRLRPSKVGSLRQGNLG